MKIVNSIIKTCSKELVPSVAKTARVEAKSISALERLYTSPLDFTHSNITTEEIAGNTKKLVSKLRELSKTLGTNGRTQEPILVRIGDADFLVRINKRIKGETHINIYGEGQQVIDLFKVTDSGMLYKPLERPRTVARSVNIVLNQKDGRMLRGEMIFNGQVVNFSRDIKTGKREMTGRYFRLVPNSFEAKDCMMKYDIQPEIYNREANVVGTTLYSLFTDLAKVKPDNLIK